MIKIILFILLSLNAFGYIGNIMALKGQAEVHNSAIHTAYSGMKITKGDTIITQNKTRVQIMLKDDTVITIGGNSSFKFENFFFDGTKKSHISMRTHRGFFRAVTGKISKLAPERFKVKTSSATIGIRGTDFSVKVETEFEHFQCYSGSIRVTFGDTFKDLMAGESFHLNPHTLKILKNQLGTGLKDKNILNSIDIADITHIETADKVIEYPRPEPLIPDGLPCRTEL